jgi:hypothetical protein
MTGCQKIGLGILVVGAALCGLGALSHPAFAIIGAGTVLASFAMLIDFGSHPTDR